MWVRFVVGFALAPRVFLPVLPFSFLHKKPTLQIPIRPGKKTCMKTSSSLNIVIYFLVC